VAVIFVLADLPIPEVLRTADFLVRPLRAADAAIAYAAYMASPEVIRRHSGGRWPTDAFTMAENQHRQILEDAGFHSQADVGEHSWTKVLFQRGAMPLPADQSLPAGFRIRPLNGHAEVDAYVALHRAVFQSESMTNAWRHRTLGHPAYLPQLDLVLTDADGLLAGFCIGWFTPQGPQAQPAGQIEPIGIRADVRNRGLGRALLGDCLARLAAAGASSVFVETDNYRDAAFNFYAAMDFRVVQDVTVYRKDYAPVSE